jgi:hypothetical protein
MKEPFRRGNAIKVLTDFSLNDINPLLFDLIQKGLSD